MKSGVPRKISDEAVKARTGKAWAEWFRILDAARAREMPHSEIATLLYEKHKVSAWWSQMVTVTYEQARGLRQAHEKPGGFEIGVSKTLDVPVAKAFAAWEDAKQRRRWLNGPGFTVRKATPSKSMRITWVDGKTNLDVYFNSKGAAKSQVAVQHNKLKNARDAARMKKYWTQQLEQLKTKLEA
jgi:hypothetical protein